MTLSSLHVFIVSYTLEQMRELEDMVFSDNSWSVVIYLIILALLILLKVCYLPELPC